MPTRLLPLLLVPLLALVAGCGAQAERASSSTDVNQLLRETFANLDKMRSAQVDLGLRIDPRGAGATGPITARLSGPFAGDGTGKLPRFQLSATLQAGPRTMQAGATWTGEKAFIALNNTQYAVSDLVARQFEAGYEQALKGNRKRSGGGALLSGLGIDFTKWLKDARNEGLTRVGDVDTVKITGQADVARVIDDLDTLAQRARSLGLNGGAGTPQQLTPQQKRQAAAAIKSVAVEVYTGAQDRILRRVVVHADVDDAASKTGGKLALDLSFTKVGEHQDIQAPKNAKSFDDLLKVTGALNGGLGNLGALGGGGGSASGSATSPATSRSIEKYAHCVVQAGGDRAKARKCADLLDG